MTKLKDLTGMVFGKLTVIKRVENNKNGKTQWLCKCDCGNEKIITSNNLVSGGSKSCGCVSKEKTIKRNLKHNKTKTRLYRIWQGMINRCRNKNLKCYKNYGGRGIKVCHEWLNDFMSFYNWSMKNGYKENLTIDRIDVNGNYEPSNCRWVTYKIQANNTRKNKYIIYNNYIHTLSEWSKIYNIKQKTLSDRINKLNWNIEKALIVPVRKMMYNNNKKEN